MHENLHLLQKKLKFFFDKISIICSFLVIKNIYFFELDKHVWVAFV
jgi:hypothetical protein